MIAEVKKLSEKYHPEVLKIRRHLHAHPELSFEEKETSDYVCDRLKEKNIPFERNWGGHGVVVNLIFDDDFEMIALRGDMDALPIQEQNEVAYQSQNPGVMHACGHDVHTANLLGAAFIINDLGAKVGKNFRFIFQPGEEKLPGGASILISEGVLKNPIPKCIIGLHVYPEMESGRVGFRDGMYMASADEIYLKVKGQGGHAAMPDRNIDTILIASSIVVALQQLASRNNPPTIPSVLSIGKINSEGGATNVIPSVVRMQGTFRTMDEAWRKEAHRLIQRICTKTAESMGGTCEVEIRKGYPYLVNDIQTTMKAQSAASEFLGEEMVDRLPIRMTSEDFAFYSQEIPSCFYRLGTGNKAMGITSSVHTPTFDIDESSLRISSGLMAYIAICQ